MFKLRWNFFYVFYVLALALSLSSCGDKDSKKAQKVSISDSKRSVLDNELIRKLANRAPVPVEKCEESIRNSLCVSKKEKNELDVNCDEKAVTKEQSDEMILTYRELPALLQNALCQVHRIQIHDNITQIAYANLYETGTDIKQKVFSIGLRAGLFLPYFEQKDYLSGKEQTAFTSNAKVLRDLQANGPVVSILSDSKSLQRLIVLAHELSHIIDYQKEITIFRNEECSKPQKYAGSEKTFRNCGYNAGRFSKISWGNETFDLQEDGTTKIVVSEADPEKNHKKWRIKFPLLSALCFYDCAATDSIPKVKETYKELSESSFPTLYATTFPEEDFAESLSLWLLQKEKKITHYDVQLKTFSSSDTTIYSPIIRIFDHLHSINFAEKKAWLEKNWAEK